MIKRNPKQEGSNLWIAKLKESGCWLEFAKRRTK